MLNIGYQEQGSGYPLVLLHGFCETREIWADLSRNLAKHFRVITADLPGCGESDDAPPGFSLEDIGTIMLAWLEQLGIVQPVLVGHSLGGYVTLAMARQRPDYFAGIGLFHSTAAPDAAEKKENRNKAISFVQKHGVEPYTDAFVEGLFKDPNDQWIPGIRAEAAKTKAVTLTGYAGAMRDRVSSLEFLKSYQRPILFLAGEADELIPVEAIREQSAAARIPVFKIIKHAAHMGMLENEPESRIQIENFIRLSCEKIIAEH